MIFTVYTVPECKYCSDALALIKSAGFESVVRPARSLSKTEWEQKIGEIPRLAPQIFLGDQHIGGFYELKRYFQDVYL